MRAESDALTSGAFTTDAPGAGSGSEQARARALAERRNLPFLSLEEVEGLATAAAGVSANFLRQARAFPLSDTDGVLLVAIADPDNAEALESLEIACGLPVRVGVAAAGDIDAAIDRACGGLSAMGRIVADLDGGGPADDDLDQLKSQASDAPVVRLVNHLIEEAVRQGASDIHIEPFADKIAVRLRVDGVMRDQEPVPKRLGRAMVSRIKILANLNIAERRLPQDGRIAHRVNGRPLDLRISTLPTVHGESVVTRLLDPGAGVRSLSSLGFDAAQEAVLQRLAQAPNGMVLVTGPTGSGKSTTLYAALGLIDARQRKLLTVEDPVEYHMERVNQVQVKPAIGLTFATVLRALVRQDPDVIMVGETRDPETADIAVHAALTGHLVLSTLHTNSAAGALTRLMDMGVEPFLLTSSVRAVIAQRLVRLLCRACRRAEPADPETLRLLADAGLVPVAGETETRAAVTIHRPVGCPDCGGTGYAGRVGIYEMMTMNEPLRALTLQRAGADAIQAAAVAGGMSTLFRDGLVKVQRGLTTLEEIQRVCDVW
ncbi:GspE/PulE family protein [Azospirillum griseum]|uniref:Type II/IV secretion system protein n=1 Tax=Azospirillum griseum TaxID=2496639 RepID=A0A3S0K4H4_9PROT|nr:GspE/PulE family protein [Azospirillum griseum]RTR20189.1 type II/IV secretion system protein [Azospirillum griseum]